MRKHHSTFIKVASHAFGFILLSTLILNKAFAAVEAAPSTTPPNPTIVPSTNQTAMPLTTLPNPAILPTASQTPTPVITKIPDPVVVPTANQMIAPLVPQIIEPISKKPDDTITATIAVPRIVNENSEMNKTLEEDFKPILHSSGRISFSFQNVAIKTLLQLISKNSGLNFIISDSIKGNATLELKNVTWKQALDIVMQSNGLASKQIGTALFISTVDDIAQLQAKEYQAAQNAVSMAPLASTLITLKYSDATNIAKVLKSDTGTLLTARGEVSVNNPTNSIIIRDVAENIIQVKKFIRKLDIPARQVSIEARIVNIDATYEAQMGVRFGVSNHNSISGTLAGANQLRQGTAPASISPLDRRLNFNLPANVLSTNALPGSIGLALANLGPILLDLELSALEEEGHTQIVSKPRVVTANQQKAIILAGEEIPYQQSTSSGATSIEFKKAVLSLEITPQITPDDKIILKLKANQDSRGTQLLVAVAQDTSATNGAGNNTTTTTTVPAVLGPPTINTQQVESQVLLNNNETVVIGGIYKLTKSNTMDRIPFFGSLPLVGTLFRHKGVRNEKTELLIFLTPKIIEQQPRQYAYKGE